MHQLEVRKRQKRYPWIADQPDRFRQNSEVFLWNVVFFQGGLNVFRKAMGLRIGEEE